LKRLGTAVIGAFLFVSFATAQETPAYKNPKLPVEQRVSDLVQRMTLEEKVAQLGSFWPNEKFIPGVYLPFDPKTRKFNPSTAEKLLKLGLGQMSRPSETRDPAQAAEFTNDLQKWVMTNTRLGIPVQFHEECLHGHAAPKGTSFPQAIGLASTWNPTLIQKVFSATALEVRARGGHQCLTPVVDLARDPRWGRTEETYGEDPYLTSRLGVAAVKGFQGNGPLIDKNHVVATAKHFAVHGQPESGTNVAPANYSERIVREYFMKPFEALVKEAHLQSVMPSYNEVDGIPSHSNKKFMQDWLRNEWGFDGVVVSDYLGISDLKTLHSIAKDDAEAGRIALESGVDVELPFTQTYLTLPQQVRDGRISEAVLNRAVARVLRQKFLLGLFDDPYVDPARATQVVNSKEHQALALEAARQSLTLLKNQNALLPLDVKKYKKIAVIGPNAADVHLGGYSDNPGRGVSILQGIKDKVGGSGQVLYSVGVKITETDADWYADKVELGDPAKNRQRIAEAVKVASQADVIVLAIGENEQTVREAWAKNHLGDRDSLDLLSMQDDLAKAMVATGKPVVVVLISGRPNSINYIAENVPAILHGWYLGQEGGTALAEVLFGEYNPGGKLPATFPRSAGQLPFVYYSKPSARRGYVDAKADPLYPFGYGLSYTTFKYGSVKVTPAQIGPAGTAKVTVEVTNAGSRKGDEVVQLYIRDLVSSVTRPVKELRGFERVSLDPGQTKTVEFTLGPEELSFLNRDWHKVVEPGEFDIMVGGNSVDVSTAKLNVTQ
jgi:beta-glucosidase